jgi:hypothetical protein
MTGKYSTPAAATDIPEFISDLNAGVFEQSLSVALSKVAAACVDHDPKKGKVTVTFDFERIAGTHQVRIGHTLKFDSPTALGKTSEEVCGADVLHVGKGGGLSLAQPSLLERQQQKLID